MVPDEATDDVVRAWFAYVNDTAVGAAASLYLADSQQLVDKLRQGVAAAGEAQLVNEAAHSLKSRSAVLGAVALSELCRQFEEMGRRGSLSGAEPLLDPLESAFADACHVFQSELEKRAA